MKGGEEEEKATFSFRSGGAKNSKRSHWVKFLTRQGVKFSLFASELLDLSLKHQHRMWTLR